MLTLSFFSIAAPASRSLCMTSTCPLKEALCRAVLWNWTLYRKISFIRVITVHDFNMLIFEILTCSRQTSLCHTHIVACIGASSVRQVLLHHSQFVLHDCCEEQLLVYCLRLENVCRETLIKKQRKKKGTPRSMRQEKLLLLQLYCRLSCIFGSLHSASAHIYAMPDFIYTAPFLVIKV